MGICWGVDLIIISSNYLNASLMFFSVFSGMFDRFWNTMMAVGGIIVIVWITLFTTCVTKWDVKQCDRSLFELLKPQL